MTRTIVVTGGSSGIGLAAAELLAAAGERIVLVGRDPGRLEAAVARVRAAGEGREPGRFTAEAARRWPDFLSVCFHPGLVRTNFGDRGLLRLLYRYAPFLVTAEKAGALLAWLITAPAGDLVNGAYYVGHETAAPRAPAGDANLAAELWKTSEAAVGIVE